MTTDTQNAALEAQLTELVESETPTYIVYDKDDEEPPQHRLVSPSEVWEAKDGSLILSAYDHGRDHPRSFRLDRIEAIHDAPSGTNYIGIDRKDS